MFHWINKNYKIIRLSMVASVFFMPVSYANTNANTIENSKYQTYVIHTYGGQDLLPAVRQQLRGRGSVSSYQDKLIIQASRSDYAKVKQLLKQIDGEPKSLTVSVKIGNESSIQGNIQQGRVMLGNTGRNMQMQARGRLSSHKAQTQNNGTYQVKTISGKPAIIGKGTLFSLTQNYIVRQLGHHGSSVGSVIYLQGKKLVPTVQGIRVRPHMLPNGKVAIDLTQRDDKITLNQAKPIQSQIMENAIIIPRGQWISVGSINQSSSSLGSGWNGQMSEVVYPIQIRVD